MSTKTSAQVVAHSKNRQGDELLSVLITFPRIILSEFNTHRMISKNTASSRAIPFKKMVEIVENDPFIPIAWQKEHKGMQGSEYFQKTDVINWASMSGDINAEKGLKELWLEASMFAIDCARSLNKSGLTKQLCNRLLEPFIWTTVLATASMEGWENFFNLRCPQYHFPVDTHFRHRSKKDCYAAHSNPDNLKLMDSFSMVDWLKINEGQAEIHMMELAECIYDAWRESTPKQLNSGEWHIPFEDKIDIKTDNRYSKMEELAWEYKLNVNQIKVKISTAMAARTSYTVVGEEKEINYEKMIELHDRLISQDPPHSSPLEHCARAMNEEEYDNFVKGHVNTLINKGRLEYDIEDFQKGWCNNFKGFIPYRYMIDNKLK